MWRCVTLRALRTNHDRSPISDACVSWPACVGRWCLCRQVVLGSAGAAWSDSFGCLASSHVVFLLYPGKPCGSAHSHSTATARTPNMHNSSSESQQNYSPSCFNISIATPQLIYLSTIVPKAIYCFICVSSSWDTLISLSSDKRSSIDKVYSCGFCW